MEIECTSAVTKVVVHARGALVTRAVTLPPSFPASGIVDVAIPDVTVAAQAGSTRAALEGAPSWVVSAVHSSLTVPKEANASATSEKLRGLTRKKARLEDERNVLSQRRDQLARVHLAPEIRVRETEKLARDPIDVRFGDTLAMMRLLASKIALLDDRIAVLERELYDLTRAIEDVELDVVQASTQDRLRYRPSRRIVVRVSGEGAVGRLLVTYAVDAARWWPTYTLRIQDGGARATWAFEALVAQRTGEDWNAATLSLSSADLVFDARLPELASLRFGRAQPKKHRPIRPAPAGVEEMFVGYTQFRPSPQPAAAPAGGATVPPASAMFAVDDDEPTGVTLPRQRAAPPTGAPPMPAPGAMPAPARAAMAPMAPMGMVMPQAARPLAKGGFGAALGSAINNAFGDEEHAAGGGFEEGMLGEPELVAGEQWNDLDALVLAGPDAPRRGKLVPAPAAFDRAAAARALSELQGNAKERWIDPSVSRGMFDHRYEAKGTADVPSDGRVHRVAVKSAPCNVLIAHRTVPSESTDVYREANVINPFDQALLGGPVDVYLDGSLLAETKMERIDRGGTLWCGMGVDDRVKVARNVRADEESAGLLGGSLSVTHNVAIELSSTIGDPIKVVVLERVPVTDDKAIEIKMVKAQPLPATYDQSERGAPVRGGCRFDVTVNPGKKTTIEMVYRLTFSAKLDIVGGSRRG